MANPNARKDLVYDLFVLNEATKRAVCKVESCGANLAVSFIILLTFIRMKSFVIFTDFTYICSSKVTL